VATAAAQGAFDAQNQFLNTMTDPFVAGAQTPYSQSSQALGYAEAPRRRGDARDAFASLEPPPASGFEQRWRVFGAAYGGSTHISGNSVVGSHDVNSQVYGGTGGATYALSPSTNVGFALNGGGTAFGLANGLGSGRSDLFQAGAFAQQAIARSGYLNTALSYGWHDVTTNRTAPITGERLRANYRAGVLAGRIEAGWRIDTQLAGVIPYAAAQAVSYRMPSYFEQGDGSPASFALGYAARNILATRSEFGLRFDRSTAVNEALLTFRGRAAWAHYFDTARNVAATFQSLPGTGFVVNGARIASDAALVTAGAELAWSNGLSLASSFEGEFSSNVASFIGRGTLRYAW
ncbi:autotransporter outer membrane beta-barrel domain-containing protein, partial [Nitrobacter winogradskyi]